jgi:hypothetical protein
MTVKMSYRKQLLRAVEAFLEETPSAHMKALRIINRARTKLHTEEKALTLDWIVWTPLFSKLSDSVFYENKEFLRETREMVLGHSSQNIASQVFSEDLRSCFTADEAEWYAQLVSMVDFILTIPFAKLHEATYQAFINRESGEEMRSHIPEIVQLEMIEEEYWRRKDIIKTIYANCPSPNNIGNEKIYHLVLREVASLLLEIEVGKKAALLGYPILKGFLLETDGATSFPPKYVDITEGLLWTTRMLNAISAKGGVLFISCRLGNAPTFNGDMLLISLH